MPAPRSIPRHSRRGGISRRETPKPPEPGTRTPEPGSILPVSDSALLIALADGKLEPVEIAQQFNIRLDLFLDWAAAPETIKRLNILIQGRAHVRHQRQEAVREEALNTLIRLQREAVERADPVEARRASIGILRFTARSSAPVHLFSAGGLPAGAGARTGGSAAGPWHALDLSRFPAQYRTRSRYIRATPILREPPVILPPPPTPDRSDSPAAATIKLLQRLQDSDNPLPGDGLRSLYNYFTPAWREGIQVKTADEFTKTNLFGYVQLIGHHSAVLLPTRLPPGLDRDTRPLSATQEAEFTDLDGQRRCVKIEFTRKSPDHPWLINDLRIQPPPPPDPAPCPCPDCAERPPPSPPTPPTPPIPPTPSANPDPPPGPAP